jgi:hypothetical protein
MFEADAADFLDFGLDNQKELDGARLLAAGLKPEAVGVMLGIAPQTVYSWRRLAKFRRAVNILAADRWESVRAKLLSGSEVAVDFLVEVLGDPDRTTRDRLRAAEIVLRLTGDATFRPTTNTNLKTIESQIAKGY